MHKTNYVKMEFSSLPENVSLARVLVASFAAQSNITISELEEIKVAISEAVSNAIIHGYQNKEDGKVILNLGRELDILSLTVEDFGVGIADIPQALEPAYSSDPDRMGLGFVFMKSFMDHLEVKSKVGEGTLISMSKKLPAKDTWAEDSDGQA